MDQSEFNKVLNTYQREIESKLCRDMPIVIGNTAKSFFDNNFQASAWIDGEPTPWAVTRRQQQGGRVCRLTV